MTVGSTIKALRDSHGLNQETLAAELEVSKTTVSNWETDLYLPKRDNLLKMAKIFRISLKEILGEDEENSLQDPEIKEHEVTGREKRFLLQLASVCPDLEILIEDGLNASDLKAMEGTLLLLVEAHRLRRAAPVAGKKNAS